MSSVNTDCLIEIGKRKRVIEPTDEEIHNSIATMIFAGCPCPTNCFMNLCDRRHNYIHAIEIIENCLRPYRNMTRKERREYFIAHVRELEFKSGTERRFYSYSIADGDQRVIVCKYTFLMCHGASLYDLKQAKQAVRLGLNAFNAFAIDEKVPSSVLSDMNSSLVNSNCNILERRDIINTIKIPYSEASFTVRCSHDNFVSYLLCCVDAHLDEALLSATWRQYSKCCRRNSFGVCSQKRNTQ